MKGLLQALLRTLPVLFALAICPSTLLAEPPEAPSPLEREAADQLLHGNIAPALALFENAARKGAPADKPLALEKATWTSGEAGVLSRLLLRAGRTAEARKVLQPFAMGPKATPERVLDLAAVLRQTGPVDERLKLLMGAAVKHKGHLQLTVALGEQLVEVGRRVEARKILDPLADRYEADEFKEAPDLAAVAKSLWLNGYVRNANDVFEQAASAALDDAERLGVELQWGLLFVDKYNWRDADKSFRKVLDIDSSEPDALCGMARIDLTSEFAVAKARTRVDGVLKANPNHLQALVLRAEVALHDENLPEARQFLERARKQRPDSPEVLRVLGAACKVADDQTCYADAEKANAKVNPTDGRFHTEVARWLEMGHRYREVLDLLNQALVRDPELWQAHAALGMGYARVADDVNARKQLEDAYSGDPFDVRTSNQLKILYDGVLKEMVLLPGRAVDLRIHRRDRKALERTIQPYLQKAYDDLVKKYGFAPARPLQVEIFPTVEQFSVRTVGLPRLGAHAVCFGHLITSRSPVEDPFNWKNVLYHELSHVFHIQASDGRVPRWLTEGLAMMESTWADPRWRSRLDRRQWDRLQAGELAKIATFNLAFTQAESMDEVVDAYHQAMFLVEYLNEQYGFAKLQALVAGHRDGSATTDLIVKILGVTPEAIDAAFATWLRQKLIRYEKDFRPTAAVLAKELGLPARVRPVEATEEPEPSDDPTAADAPATGEPAPAPAAAGKAPRDWLVQAIGALRQGRPDLAFALLKGELAKVDDKAAPPQPVPGPERDLCAARFLLMELAVEAKDRMTANAQAKALVDVPAGRCDGVRQHIVLALTFMPKASEGLSQSLTADIAGLVQKRAEILLPALGLDPSDASVGGLWIDLVVRAVPALERGDDRDAQAWLKSVANAGNPSDLRDIARTVTQLEANDVRAPALLGRLAWAGWRLALAEEKSRHLADLRLAAQALEEADPAGRASVLAEARASIAAGSTMAALPVYRLAAERSKTKTERAEVWCELADVAQGTAATADREEAVRRCTAEQPPSTVPAIR